MHSQATVAAHHVVLAAIPKLGVKTALRVLMDMLLRQELQLVRNARLARHPAQIASLARAAAAAKLLQLDLHPAALVLQAELPMMLEPYVKCALVGSMHCQRAVTAFRVVQAPVPKLGVNTALRVLMDTLLR